MVLKPLLPNVMQLLGNRRSVRTFKQMPPHIIDPSPRRTVESKYHSLVRRHTRIGPSVWCKQNLDSSVHNMLHTVLLFNDDVLRQNSSSSTMCCCQTKDSNRSSSTELTFMKSMTNSLIKNSSPRCCY